MCLSIIYFASHSLLSFFFITVKASLSFFHSFIHSLINLVFIVLLSIKYWIYRNGNNTFFVFLELIKWGTETSKPTEIVHVKCYSGCRQRWRCWEVWAHYRGGETRAESWSTQTECDCVFSTAEVKCSAGAEKNIPEREANCVLAQGPAVVEQSWLSLGECVLFSVLLEVRLQR